MPDIDTASGKDYGIGIPYQSQGFHVKGSDHYDWGMKSRLSRIFQPKSGRTLMLAFDHGYFLGPTSGLERLDLRIPPLVPYIDVLMGTRGALRTCISPALSGDKAIALRCSSGSSVLEDDLSNECVSVDVQDAVRMNADCMALQVFVGAPYQKQTIENLKEEVRDVGDEAERATRETENSLELRTRDRYRKLIGKIDSTLKRLEGGDYGYCVDTGEEIGLDRLEARLTAERTIDAQERWEHLQKQQGD